MKPTHFDLVFMNYKYLTNKAQHRRCSVFLNCNDSEIWDAMLRLCLQVVEVEREGQLYTFNVVEVRPQLG